MFDFLSEKFAGVLDWLKNKGRLTESNINEAVKQIREILINCYGEFINKLVDNSMPILKDTVKFLKKHIKKKWKELNNEWSKRTRIWL